LFYAALSVAWILGNPAGAAPDEPSDYLNALAVASGELKGEPVIAALPASGDDAKNDARKQAGLERTTRAVDVPPGLSPEGLECNAFKSNLSAACQEGIQVPPGPTKGFTNFALAHPTTYLVSGALARVADNPVDAIRLGRLGDAAVSIGLVWMAIALLWERSSGPRSIVGLLAAATPMLIFVASSLNACGPEVAAGVCFFSALLRVTRPSEPRTWTWVVLGVSGVVLAASRTLGPPHRGLRHGDPGRRSWLQAELGAALLDGKPSVLGGSGSSRRSGFERGLGSGRSAPRPPRRLGIDGGGGAFGEGSSTGLR